MSFVLRNHSQVHGLKELQFFGDHWDPRDGLAQMSEGRLTAALADLEARERQGILLGRASSAQRRWAAGFLQSLPADKRNPRDVFAAFVRRECETAGKTIPCEQTPRNIFYARALLEQYPEARIVHMLRDPRAVMASQKKRWQRRRLAADRETVSLRHSVRTWVNYHPYTVAKLWRRANQTALGLAEHPRVSLVSFEELLQRPEESLRALCTSLDIDFEPAMLEVGQINSSHQSSVGGARSGLRPEAIDTWRRSLTPAELAVTERICGDLMARLGYTRETAGSVSEARFRVTYLLHLAGVAIVNPGRAWIQLRAVSRSFRRGSGGERKAAQGVGS